MLPSWSASVVTSEDLGPRQNILNNIFHDSVLPHLMPDWLAFSVSESLPHLLVSVTISVDVVISSSS
jgi:hypothetical protein